MKKYALNPIDGLDPRVPFHNVLDKALKLYKDDPNSFRGEYYKTKCNIENCDKVPSFRITFSIEHNAVFYNLCWDHFRMVSDRIDRSDICCDSGDKK